MHAHLALVGHQVHLTFRDSDEERLLARLDVVRQRFPLVVQPTDTQAPPAGWCARQGVQRKRNHGKDGRQWDSHTTADGWYKGRERPPWGSACALPHCQRRSGSCLLYTSPSPRDGLLSRMPSSA